MNYDFNILENTWTPLHHYDLFLCSSGYEERTLGALEKLKDNVKFEKALINFYKPDDPDLLQKNIVNLNKIQSLLSEISTKQETFNIKPTEAIEFNDILMKNLQNIESILIDITSFTRLFLYSILSICLKLKLKTHLVYTEPGEYTMNFAQGLEEIVIMPSNPGIPDQSKKLLLIMFLGWESLRIGSVIEEWEPDKIITIAESSEDKKREKWNAITLEQCSTLIEMSDFSLVPALVPRETLAKLEELYTKYHNEFDICLVNGGPKIQCLAFSEFAFKHPEVQILYPKPYRWHQELPPSDESHPTSKGVGRSYLFNYPVSALIEKPIEL